jgi:hypothetical protein
MSLFNRAPKPIIGPWSDMEKPVLQLGILGKERAIKEYVIFLPPEYPGKVDVHWRETKHRTKTNQQGFAVHGSAGPQCPHCTSLQLFTALATTAAGAYHTEMRPYVDAYNTILKRGSTPTYIIEFIDGEWKLDCRAHRGDARTKYDCQEHKQA